MHLFCGTICARFCRYSLPKYGVRWLKNATYLQASGENWEISACNVYLFYSVILCLVSNFIHYFSNMANFGRACTVSRSLVVNHQIQKLEGSCTSPPPPTPMNYHMCLCEYIHKTQHFKILQWSLFKNWNITVSVPDLIYCISLYILFAILSRAVPLWYWKGGGTGNLLIIKP